MNILSQPCIRIVSTLGKSLPIYTIVLKYIQKPIKFQLKNNTIAKAFNLNSDYIDDVLSINHPNLANWIQLIYHNERK